MTMLIDDGLAAMREMFAGYSDEALSMCRCSPLMVLRYGPAITRSDFKEVIDSSRPDSAANREHVGSDIGVGVI